MKKIIEIGKKVKQQGGFEAFVPHPFPPKQDFEFGPKLLKKNDEATRLLGKLDGITKLLPDVNFFLLMYLRKDAASSSQIEGTMATMIDAIEAPWLILALIFEYFDTLVNRRLQKDIPQKPAWHRFCNKGLASRPSPIIQAYTLVQAFYNDQPPL